MTNEQLSKLPKWAQEEFTNLQRERNTAVRELKSWTDDQKPSSIYIDELVCDGEQQGPKSYRRYIQSRKVTMVHAGVEATLYAIQPDRIELFQKLILQ